MLKLYSASKSVPTLYVRISYFKIVVAVIPESKITWKDVSCVKIRNLYFVIYF